jgi:hypothetical protein
VLICCPSSVLRPPFSVLRRLSCVIRIPESLWAIRSIRAGFEHPPSRSETFNQNFFYQTLGGRNASSSGSGYSHALAAQPSFPRSTENRMRQKTHISWAFPSKARNSIDGMRNLPHGASLPSGVAGAHATYGVDARASTLDQAKMLVFLSRCSNPNAVFAIPAGTKRHRHSLMARRAAWRRSERRRRSQRRKRARARQSAGRRSNSPLPVFDFERRR